MFDPYKLLKIILNNKNNLLKYMTNRIIEAIDNLVSTLDKAELAEVYNNIREKIEPQYEYDEQHISVNPAERPTPELVFRPYLRGVLHYLYHDNVSKAKQYYLKTVKGLEGFATSLDGIIAGNLVDAVINYDHIEYDQAVSSNIWNNGESDALKHIRKRIVGI